VYDVFIRMSQMGTADTSVPSTAGAVGGQVAGAWS
jgi:hypothetical protein